MCTHKAQTASKEDADLLLLLLAVVVVLMLLLPSRGMPGRLAPTLAMSASVLAAMLSGERASSTCFTQLLTFNAPTR
jgi:hypothetical protein